ncbi:hypothetical protein F511_25011 [Dorcoceras hygrometricum]|uniref:Uncharacterized protein n=1 Tax=Dorcoceras hygrometricum TaxID=472368 RepID=A0A2Z7CY34_9LAMI|nr:hypothetical protein F511_25011 [Dorcoceras hygrometricum]
MMNSRRICPADGSQYKRSAVGLVFMESAAGLTMETSKVESALAISRWSEAKKMMRRRAKESADGLALMTSSVTSSYSADGLRYQSQESAGSLHPDARGSDVVKEISSRKLLFTSRCYLEIAIAKRCRLHKLIRQRFALTLKIQQEYFALIISAVASYRGTSCNAKISRRKQHSIQSKSLYESAVANQLVASFASSRHRFPDARKEEVAKRSSRSDKPAAKQLTIYEELSKLDVNC